MTRTFPVFNGNFTIILCAAASQAVNNRWTSIDSTIPTQNFRNLTFYLNYYVESWLRSCQYALLDIFVTSYVIDQSYTFYQNINKPLNITWGANVLFEILNLGLCTKNYAPTMDNISNALEAVTDICTEGECEWKWFWNQCEASSCSYETQADLLTAGLAVLGALGPIWAVLTIAGTFLYGQLPRQDKTMPIQESISLNEPSALNIEQTQITQEKLPS